jgi:isocitrate dehydrogenase kinase/phosphatase
VREIFMRHHAELLEPEFWQQHQQRIADGHVHDVFPYDPQRRFARARPASKPRRDEAVAAP